MKLLLLVLMLSATSFAQATKWEHLTDTADQKVFVDLSTMKGDSKGKELWFKFVPLNRAGYVAKLKLPRNYGHSLALIYFRCEQRTSLVKRTVWYSVKGSALRSLGSTDEAAIPPGSLHAEMHGLLCSP